MNFKKIKTGNLYRIINLPSSIPLWSLKHVMGNGPGPVLPMDRISSQAIFMFLGSFSDSCSWCDEFEKCIHIKILLKNKIGILEIADGDEFMEEKI